MSISTAAPIALSTQLLNRVVGVTNARPRAYDVQRALSLLGFCALAGTLMLPSIVALLSLTGQL